jgi:hypothetical protein
MQSNYTTTINGVPIDFVARPRWTKRILFVVWGSYIIAISVAYFTTVIGW